MKKKTDNLKIFFGIKNFEITLDMNFKKDLNKNYVEYLKKFDIELIDTKHSVF
jgi:hypothetical protein